jgi:nucleotide-binding universal stress UspA family protein
MNESTDSRTRSEYSGRPDPLSTILMPVDDAETFKRVASLTGSLLRVTGLRPQKTDLLHVVTGTFLGELMKGLDLASGETPAPAKMNELHRQHLESTVQPLVLSCREMIDQEIGAGLARTIVRDGDPVKIISSASEYYTSLILCRRNLASSSEKLIGSVVAGVLHRYSRATTYLVGDRVPTHGDSLFSRCLIAVDDSPASMNSVAEAGGILARADDQVGQIYLVHVLDQSCYYDEDGENCMDASLTGQKALEESGNLLVDLGVDRQKIKTVIHFGKPGTILAEEVESCDATLVFLGRRDRSRMAQVFLGSVCTDIIQNCRDRTLVLSS